MDEQTRYRVTGSLFLLALAIVILPMLFDGDGIADVDIQPLVVPETTPEVERRADLAPDSKLESRARQLAAQVDAEGFEAAAGGTRFGEPVLKEVPEAERSTAWAVQVASLKDEENALKLRDRLRADGFEAFISTVRRNGEVLNRVAVGPLIDREAAQRLRDELSRSLSLDARVVAFSS